MPEYTSLNLIMMPVNFLSALKGLIIDDYDVIDLTESFVVRFFLFRKKLLSLSH